MARLRLRYSVINRTGCNIARDLDPARGAGTASQHIPPQGSKLACRLARELPRITAVQFAAPSKLCGGKASFRKVRLTRVPDA